MNNKTEAYKFLREKGINPVEPIYWDSPSKRIDLDELLQEFAAQQNKAKQTNIEILRADNKANIEKIEALESELSKQKDKIAELENTNAGFEGIIKSHKEIIKNLEDDASKQKELVEEQKEIIDVSNRVGIDLVKKNGELESTIESQAKEIEALKKEIEFKDKLLKLHALPDSKEYIETLSTPTTEPKEERKEEDLLSMLKDIQSSKNKHYFLRLFADGSGTVNNCGDKNKVFTYDSITKLKQFLKNEAKG